MIKILLAASLLTLVYDPYVDAFGHAKACVRILQPTMTYYSDEVRRVYVHDRCDRIVRRALADEGTEDEELVILYVDFALMQIVYPEKWAVFQDYLERLSKFNRR